MAVGAKVWVAALVALAAVGACGGDSDIAEGLHAREARRAAPEAMGQEGSAYQLDAAGGSDGSAVAVDLPATGPSIIKTAGVTLRIAEGDLQDSLSAVVDVARSHGGFVLSTSVEEAGERSGTVVIRVPAEAFEEALADARSLGEVVSEEVSGEDVTQEFVDLDARLRNFEAQESVLLDLMAESTSVADTLRVQRELQDVQLEIERLRGRLRYLRDQTDLSTITLRLREQEGTAAGAGLWERAWNRSVDTFNAIVSAVVVGLSVAVPVALFLVLILLLARFLRPRLPSWGTREG
jgi:hypothetical protein